MITAAMNSRGPRYERQQHDYKLPLSAHQGSTTPMSFVVDTPPTQMRVRHLCSRDHRVTSVFASQRHAPIKLQRRWTMKSGIKDEQPVRIISEL
jgi:hypothetical protein